jgi:hypothetical protein
MLQPSHYRNLPEGLEVSQQRKANIFSQEGKKYSANELRRKLFAIFPSSPLSSPPRQNAATHQVAINRFIHPPSFIIES